MRLETPARPPVGQDLLALQLPHRPCQAALRLVMGLGQLRVSAGLAAVPH